MIQLQFLNYLLKTKDSSLLLLNNINDEFFSDYKKEYSFITDHISKYGRIPDTETFLANFPDFDIISVNETPKYLITELYKDKNTRYLASTFNKVRNLVNDNKIDDAVTLYTKAAQDMVKETYLNTIDIFHDTSRYVSYTEKSQDYKKFYIKTGFKELDELIGGWDREEELATIVARTGVGKSWSLLKVAIAAAEQGLTVGIYSGEMSDKKVGYRIDTLISHISNKAIMHGDSYVQPEYKKYIDSLPTRFKGTIKILTPSMINGPAGVTALQAFIEKDNLDMLCIDQHSLLEDDRKAKNPVEKAANISKDLKNLQVLKKIPIISVSQQNRESTELGVTTAHIAQSDRIAQDSTVIIFFEQKDNNILVLNLVKSRDSVNGKKIQYALDFDKGVFQYIPSENDGLQGKSEDTSCEQLKEEFMENSGDEVF